MHVCVCEHTFSRIKHRSIIGICMCVCEHTFSRIKHRSIIGHVEAYAPLRLWCRGLT
jgi:hypothetical protein